jgi:hypothetical protein
LILDQVNSLRREREHQDAELKKSEVKAHEAMTLATEEASKLKTAKDVIKSLTAQVSSSLNLAQYYQSMFFSYVILDYMTAIVTAVGNPGCMLVAYLLL